MEDYLDQIAVESEDVVQTIVEAPDFSEMKKVVEEVDTMLLVKK